MMLHCNIIICSNNTVVVPTNWNTNPTIIQAAQLII